MTNKRQLLWGIVILSVVLFCSVSCDTDDGNQKEKEKEKEEDYSGLLAEYAGKVTVPALGELPAFTAGMGIPVRDDVEAELILESMFKESWYTPPNKFTISGSTVFFVIQYDVDYAIERHLANKGITGNEIKIDNTALDDRYYSAFDPDLLFYCIAFRRSDPGRLGDFIQSGKFRFNKEKKYRDADITIHEGSIHNSWYLERRKEDYRDDTTVERTACGYTVSQGGFCAKIIVEYTYFSNGNYPGEGVIKVYGENDRELFVKKISTRRDFRDFWYFD